MPWAIVGIRHFEHGGLLTNWKNEPLNHLDEDRYVSKGAMGLDHLGIPTYFNSARITQSW